MLSLLAALQPDNIVHYPPPDLQVVHLDGVPQALAVCQRDRLQLNGHRDGVPDSDPQGCHDLSLARLVIVSSQLK